MKYHLALLCSLCSFALLFAQTDPPSPSVYHNQVYNLAFQYADFLKLYPVASNEDHLYVYDSTGKLLGSDFAHKSVDLDRAGPVDQSIFGVFGGPDFNSPFSLTQNFLVYPKTSFSLDEIKAIMAYELREDISHLKELSFPGGTIIVPRQAVYSVSNDYNPEVEESAFLLSILHGEHWYKLSWQTINEAGYEYMKEMAPTPEQKEMVQEALTNYVQPDFLEFVNTLEINGHRLQLEADDKGVIQKMSLIAGELTTEESKGELEKRFTTATADIEVVPSPKRYTTGHYQAKGEHQQYWAPQHNLSIQIPAGDRKLEAKEPTPQRVKYELTDDFTVAGVYLPHTSSYNDKLETFTTIEGGYQFFRTPYAFGGIPESVEVAHLKADWTDEMIRKMYSHNTTLAITEDLQAFPQEGFTLYCPQTQPRMFQVANSTMGSHSAVVLLHEGEWLHIVNLHLKYRHESMAWLNTLTFRGRQLEISYHNGELQSADFVDAESARTISAEDQAFLRQFRATTPVEKPLRYPQAVTETPSEENEEVDAANAFAYRYMEQVRNGEKPSVNTAVDLELAELRLSSGKSTWKASLEHGISLTYLIQLADPACIRVNIGRSFCTLEDDLGNDLMEGHIPFVYEALREHKKENARVPHAGWTKERQMARQDFAHQVFAQTLVLPEAGASFLRMQGILYVDLLSDDWYTADFPPQTVEQPAHFRGIISTDGENATGLNWSQNPDQNTLDRSRLPYQEFLIVGHPDNFVALEVLDETGNLLQTLGRNDSLRIPKTEDGKLHFPSMRMTMARPQTVTLDLDEIIHLGLK